MTPTQGSTSVKLGALGQRIAGIEAIERQIAIILMTSPGSDPLRPEFGAYLVALIDLPSPMAEPLGARRIKAALARWMEGQIKVLAVDFKLLGNLRNEATVDLEYEVTATGQISSRAFQIKGVA